MAGAEKKKGQTDDQQELDRALERGQREDLLGDMEENRNLTGSTTWETLDDDDNTDDRNKDQERR